MSDLPGRIAEQFSDRGDRADVWRALDAVVATDRFLNLGYSPRFGSHLVGEPQRRLARVVLDRLEAAGARTAGTVEADATPRLLDVGCGRGGPACVAATEYGYDVTGVDLVRYNVRRAVEGRPAADPPEFAVADATRLPFEAGSFAAAASVDAIVYVPDRAAAFAEVARVLRDGSPAVVSDLVAAPDADEAALERFAAAWDMPAPAALADYRDAVTAGGLDVADVLDVSAHSVDRFRTWTGLFLRLVEGPADAVVRRALARYDLSRDAIVRQVRAAHDALPDLRHVVVTARA